MNELMLKGVKKETLDAYVTNSGIEYMVSGVAYSSWFCCQNGYYSNAAVPLSGSLYECVIFVSPAKHSGT